MIILALALGQTRSHRCQSVKCSVIQKKDPAYSSIQNHTRICQQAALLQICFWLRWPKPVAQAVLLAVCSLVRLMHCVGAWPAGLLSVFMGCLANKQLASACVLPPSGPMHRLARRCTLVSG